MIETSVKPVIVCTKPLSLQKSMRFLTFCYLPGCNSFVLIQTEPGFEIVNSRKKKNHLLLSHTEERRSNVQIAIFRERYKIIRADIFFQLILCPTSLIQMSHYLANSPRCYFPRGHDLRHKGTNNVTLTNRCHSTDKGRRNSQRKRADS